MLSLVHPFFQATAAYPQHPCHQDLFTLHQAISALVKESVRGEMSPRDDAAMQRND
jgi:cytochrome c